MQETRVRSLGWEDPLQKEMATHFSILAWRIPWTEKTGGLQSMGSQRIRHNLATKLPTTSENKDSNLQRKYSPPQVSSKFFSRNPSSQEKNCQPRLLYQRKLSFRYKGNIKTFSDKQNLREFTTRCVLYKILKGDFQAETD